MDEVTVTWFRRREKKRKYYSSIVLCKHWLTGSFLSRCFSVRRYLPDSICAVRSSRSCRETHCDRHSLCLLRARIIHQRIEDGFLFQTLQAGTGNHLLSHIQDILFLYKFVCLLSCQASILPGHILCFTKHLNVLRQRTVPCPRN